MLTMEIQGIDKLEDVFNSLPNVVEGGVKVQGPAVDYASAYSWGYNNIPSTDFKRFTDKVNIADVTACWLWNAGRRGGYGELLFEGKIHPAHVLAFLFANGPFGDYWILHKCDTRPCCNPYHLFKGTCLDNHRDMLSKGRAGWQIDKNWASWASGKNHWSKKYPNRIVKGSAAGRAKLNEQQVLDIRQRLCNTSKAALAREFNVSETLIYNIAHRLIWRHI